MTDSALAVALSNLPNTHRNALEWFADNAGTIQPWPGELDDGTLLATKAKGIYKPAWSEYALSVRQTISGPYPDKEPVRRQDGTWRYLYFQEGADPADRDAEFTNKGLMACRRDGVPIGVMRQVSGKPRVRYEILGVALVAAWEGGYFHLEGFSRSGSVHRPGSEGVLEGVIRELESIEEEGAFDPGNVQDHRKRALASVVRRRGQPSFRRALLERYGGACLITGCQVSAVLEASHITGYLGDDTNHPTNGLLLRADIHTLFDLGLLAIDESTLRVVLAHELLGSEYGSYHGKPLLLRADNVTPSPEALRFHRTWAGIDAWKDKP